ncbi:hypothetical protein ACWEO2_41240 [Nocardia sp. NPDC004278]
MTTAWPDRVAAAVTDALAEGAVSLDRVAHRLATSPRTLHRRLLEAGTTWRSELERARNARLAQANVDGPLSRTRQAELLGYSDAGSMRRAARRRSMTQPMHRSDLPA